jgi:hypothetical protein
VAVGRLLAHLEHRRAQRGGEVRRSRALRPGGDRPVELGGDGPINFDGDVTASNRPEIQPVNAVDPDLGRFFARGGKLLLVDGWSDTAVPPCARMAFSRAL